MDNILIVVVFFLSTICSRSVLAQSEGDVRLVGGTSSNEGRVEIYHNYQWGTVCDDYWDEVDASVVCKQLNYNHAVRATDRAYFGEGSGKPIYLDNVDCAGYETRLTQCSDRGWGVEDCGHSEDAGVICTNAAPSNGDIRLSDGLLLEEGRVEIYYNGVWGTICDDGWGYDEARVACYQLGYSGVTYSDTFYGAGNDPILLDDVFCYGWESAIAYCYHDPWYSHNCGHNEDVGIRCYRSGSGISGWLISIIVISSTFVCVGLFALVARMCSKNKSKRNQTMQSQPPAVAYNISSTTTATAPGSFPPAANPMYGQSQPYPPETTMYQAHPPPSYTTIMQVNPPQPNGTAPVPAAQHPVYDPTAVYPPPTSNAPPAGASAAAAATPFATESGATGATVQMTEKMGSTHPGFQA